MSLYIVCLIANIFPGALTKSQRLPLSNFGLQLAPKEPSSVVDIIDPIKIACGSILIPKSLISKSTLVIPTLQISSSPQNDVTSISFLELIICGNDSISVDDLNSDPLN